jgi:hypothetical protein
LVLLFIYSIDVEKMTAAKGQAKPETLTPVALIGRGEMNLAEFPIHALTDHVPEGQHAKVGRSDYRQLYDAYPFP